MIAVDSSVVVAAFASWHEAHQGALGALRRGPRLPAHVGLESFSVLTRLPPPHRVKPELVADLLRTHFAEGPLVLPPPRYRRLIDEVTAAGFAGGAVYDALVAATAEHAGALLLSRDRRAARVYEALGARYEMLD